MVFDQARMPWRPLVANCRRHLRVVNDGVGSARQSCGGLKNRTGGAACGRLLPDRLRLNRRLSGIWNGSGCQIRTD